PEYVLNTSEFVEIKARVLALHGKKSTPDPKSPDRPALRRNPNGTIDSSGQETVQPDSDDRPTLKRRE
ncbi:MAG TPA: hypothetical protein VHC72_12615, partial [Bryobacteraceae bacterium]|nr:hypothetical protein [Bryobacteraceae bacterium]